MCMGNMPKANDAIRDFFMDNENFADLFNGYLFQGEQVVKAEELSDVPSEYELSLEEKNKGKKKRILRVSQYRDVIKKSTAGTEYVILGIENQEKIHYNMPVRTMLYDAVTYMDQLKRIAMESRSYDGWTADEFLSKIPKGTKIIPCYTIVLYYGENQWDGPMCLKDMFSEDVSFGPFIQDYKMNLIEMRKGKEGYHFKNKQLIEFLEMLREVYEKSDSLNTYSGRIAQLVGIVVNDEKIYQMGKKEAEVIMCRATEELREEGRREERAKTEAEKARADKAEAEKNKAEAEKNKAEAEKNKAEAEKNKAEAENELLKEEIKRLQDMINKNKEG